MGSTLWGISRDCSELQRKGEWGTGKVCGLNSLMCGRRKTREESNIKKEGKGNEELFDIRLPLTKYGTRGEPNNSLHPVPGRREKRTPASGTFVGRRG